MMPRTVLVIARLVSRARKPETRNRNWEAKAWLTCSRRFSRSVLAVPNALVGEIEQAAKDEEEDHHIEAGALPFFHFWIGGPGQEGNDVTRFLIESGHGPVDIHHGAIHQWRRHGDLMTAEIGIVKAAGADLFICRRLLAEAGQNRID